MTSAKKNAPDANGAQGQSDIEMSRCVAEHGLIVARQTCFVAQQDLTPEAAATALHAASHAVARSLLCLTGGSPHASLSAVQTALKALEAAGDSLAAIAGRVL
ncbi:hypothetical protein [Roseateles sp.]|uniref:hypothetical protein n=1 Tax=Roseateles sp. TaxID=1971397 RepID=UPI003BA6DE21